ncbi:condensin-2 complex subunit D3 [Latimeria chalumnae]|uniref:condensin-2 complex subunit D3 n=1 Tax=Latimeria chalumnae TaxID=7897 RepID=UPI00313DC1C7
MANRLERELLERIRALWLETIPPVWVDTVWELDFTETEQLDPHIEQEILENGLEVFTELYSSLLPFAVEEQSTGPGRDLWILFAENGISHNTLVAVLYHFIQLVQNKKASVEQREYSLYAAGLYFLLLEIPGSIANRVLHPVLFDKSLDTLKKSWPQDVDLRRKRKKDTMKSSRGDPKGRKRGRPIRRGYSEMDDIFEEEEDQGEEYFSTQGILQIREAIFLLLKNFLRFLPKFSLKDKPQSLQHCLQILIEMTRFEPVTGELYFLVEINEIKSLPVLAYHGLLLLCSPFHGEGDKTLRCVFHRILNVILMMEGGERSNLVPHTITQQVLNAREQAVEFVSYVVDEQKETALPVLHILLQHICVKVPDKLEYRTHAAQALVKLLTKLPCVEYVAFIDWLYRYSWNSKISYRTFALDVAIALLDLPERAVHSSIAQEHQKYLHHKFLIQVMIFGRCSDKAPTVRSRALSCLAQCLEMKVSTAIESLQELLQGKEDSGEGWCEVEGVYPGKVSDTFYTSTGTDLEQGVRSKTPVQDASFWWLIEKMAGVLALELSSASEADQSRFMQVLQERSVNRRYLVPEGESPPLASHPSVESTVASAANDQACTQRVFTSAPPDEDARRWDTLGPYSCEGDECLHRLDIKRSLQIYFDRTKDICKSDQIFVSYGQGRLGMPLYTLSNPQKSQGTFKTIEVIGTEPTPPFDGKEIMVMLRQRVKDEKTNVRKSALQVFMTILKYNVISCTPEDLSTMQERCRDPAVSVRKQALQSLTDLLMVQSTDRQLQKAWLTGVVPVVIDSESSVQEKALDCLDQVILRHIKNHSRLTESDSNQMLAWDLLTLIATESQELNRYLTKAFCYWSKKDKFSSMFISNLISHTQTEHSLAAWMVLAKVAGSSPKLNYDKIIETWDSISRQRNTSTESTGHVLTVIGHIGRHLPDSSRARLIDDVKKWLKAFHSPPEVISPAVDALYKLCQAQAHSPEESQALLNQVCGELISACKSYISNIVLKEEGAGQLQEDMLVRYLFTLGEAAQLSPAKVEKQIFLLVQSFLASSVHVDHYGEDLPASQPLSQFSGSTMPTVVRAHAFITLGKLCLQHEDLAKKCIAALARELEVCEEVAIRNNVIIVMCDLCIRYTTMVDRYIPNIAMCLKDQDPFIRKQTLIMLTNLLQEEFVKWKGSLFFRFAQVLVDPDPSIASFVEFCLVHLLLKRNPVMFSQHFVECIFHFNGYEKHEKYNKFPQSEREKSLFSLKGNKNKEKRMKIYKFLLEHFTDEQRFNITTKISQNVLACFVDGLLPLDIDANHLLSDTFDILSCKAIKLSSMRSKPEEDIQVDDDEMAMASAVMQVAQKKLISQVQKKNFIENIIPIITSLKGMLEQKRMPVLKDLMTYLREMMQDYRNEIKDFFAVDKQLAAELEYDMKKYEEQLEREKEMENPLNSPDSQGAPQSSRKAFPKHSAPASSTLAPVSRAASAEECSEAPAPAGSKKTLVYLDSESEPEVCSEATALKTPDPSPRRESSKPRDATGPTPSDPRKGHKHGSSRSRCHAAHSEEATLGPLLRDILARLNSLESGSWAPPVPSTPGAASRPLSPVLVLPLPDPVSEPTAPTPDPAPAPASDLRALGSSSRPSASGRITKSPEPVQAGLSGAVPKRILRPVISSEEEDEGEVWREAEGVGHGVISDAFYTSTGTDSEQGRRATPSQDVFFRGLIEKMAGVLALELSSASEADQSRFMQLLGLGNCALDLKDAYTHVAICPSHKRFLRLIVNGRHFQYQGAPGTPELIARISKQGDRPSPVQGPTPPTEALWLQKLQGRPTRSLRRRHLPLPGRCFEPPSSLTLTPGSLHSGSNTELEASTDSGRPKTPEPSPRSTVSKAQLTSGKRPRDSQEDPDSSPSQPAPLVEQGQAIAPLLRDIMTILQRLEPPGPGHPVPSTSSEPSGPRSQILPSGAAPGAGAGRPQGGLLASRFPRMRKGRPMSELTWKSSAPGTSPTFSMPLGRIRNRDARKWDSIGKRVYASASLAVRISSYVAHFSQYAHDLWSEAASLAELVPQDRREEVRHLIDDGTEVSRALMQAALDFSDTSTRGFRQPASARGPEQVMALEKELSAVLASRAVEPVPEDQGEVGFYSQYFLISKKSGGVRLILDLRRLNSHLRVEKFRMVSLGTLIPSLSQGDWFCALDLKDMYTHIAIRPSHRKFLRFTVNGRHYQYRVLPFGLATASRVFTKVLVVVASHLCRQGTFVYPYFDDWLIRGSSKEEAARGLSVTTRLLGSFGFVLNLEKSQLCPVQNITFIGAVLDAVQGTAFLPQERVEGYFLMQLRVVKRFLHMSLSTMAILNSAKKVLESTKKQRSKSTGACASFLFPASTSQNKQGNGRGKFKLLLYDMH